MGLLGGLMQWGSAGVTGFQAGLAAARRVFEDPQTAYQQQYFRTRVAEYSLLWAYYNNSMFDKSIGYLNNWTTYRTFALYKSNYNLYRNIRLIYNPTRRLVDFYAGAIYPGVLSEDGSDLPDSVPLAVPFAEDTDDALKDAIAQFWAWSNWQSKKAVQVRYGAALGSVLIEICDDLDRGKVTAEIIWPGFVTNLRLDSAGNVKSYWIEYLARDQNGSYTYRKEVDLDSFRYFKDNQPFDYSETGAGAVVENPYGFIPAVWIQHINVGGDHGSAAISGSMGKIDELNNLVSHVHDQIHKKIGAPLVMWSDGSVQSLFNNKKRGSTEDFDVPTTDQENVLVLKGPAGGGIDHLAGDLNLADSAVYMDKLLGEIEQDHPELVFYKELRGMSQVTGPAASRLVGDVASRVAEVMANYDQANISLFRMAVAIAGFRANSGAWGPLNRQQQKFTPFDLYSYERGDLDIAIMPRPLLTPTKSEVAQEKTAMWTGVKMAVDAGATLEFVLRDEGYTDEELTELGNAKMQQIQRDQMLSQEDTIPQMMQ